METKTFNKFREIVYARSGINLGPTKESLVESRVAKRLRVLGLDDYEDYLKYLKADKSGDELISLLDVISTNVTSFFREAEHFKVLTSFVQSMIGKGQTRFRLWSAASSTGEEPYTMAMSLLDSGAAKGVDLKILATDISTRVLDTAKEGIYTKKKLEGIPEPYLRKYFIKTKTDGNELYQVRDEIRNMVVFSRINLSKPPFPMNGPFDVVFCRNVMIYFDNVVRKKLLGDISRLLRVGGYLMVGHAESLTGMLSDFESVKPSVYIKRL